MCLGQIAKMEKLKPLETKVQQLTELAKELQDYFEQMQTRRRERRGSNGEILMSVKEQFPVSLSLSLSHFLSPHFVVSVYYVVL